MNIPPPRGRMQRMPPHCCERAETSNEDEAHEGCTTDTEGNMFVKLDLNIYSL